MHANVVFYMSYILQGDGGRHYIWEGGGLQIWEGGEGNEITAPYYGKGVTKTLRLLKGRVMKSLFISYMYKFPQFQNPYFQLVFQRRTPGHSLPATSEKVSSQQQPATS